VKLDALVLKRLDELIAKGDAIHKTREFDFTNEDGKQY
jgi:hypothetical protein